MTPNTNLSADEISRAEGLAVNELRDEKFRERVEEHKIYLRRRRWWHRLFPFTIEIKRR